MTQAATPMDPLTYIESYKAKCLTVLKQILETEVVTVIEILSAARTRNSQVFVCGNGGSAAAASHLATDLGKGASLGRPLRFRVLSLTDNVPWITALANDTDYSQVFVEQLKNHARPQDVLLAFSGSGNSPNVLRAIEWANQHDLITIGITGRPGGQLGQTARYPVFVESSHMGHIEDGHVLIQHMVAYYFMESA